MTDAERREIEREAARRVLVQWRFGEERLAAEVDRLFPPLPQAEPETLRYENRDYRVGPNGRPQCRRLAGEWYQEWSEDQTEELLALARAVQRHRDRAWVAQHPEGVIPDPAGPDTAWRVREHDIIHRDRRTAVLYAAFPKDRVELLYRLWNGSR